MNTRWVRAALFAAWLLSVTGCGNGDGPGTGAGSPAAGGSEIRPAASTAAGGSFAGRVLLDGPAPGRAKLMVVKDVSVCGKIDHLDDRLVVGEGGGIRYAVVSVRGVKNGKGIATLGSDFVLDQRTCAYFPHVLIVPTGAPLRILNNDGVLHNIHTFSTLNKPFNVAQPKVLRELERTFTVPERIPVRCDVHGWMSSWVIVVDHPYHAVTDADGRFEISGIPPGRYTVECWQEELGVRTAEITVTGDRGCAHDFVYTSTPPASGLN